MGPEDSSVDNELSRCEDLRSDLLENMEKLSWQSMSVFPVRERTETLRSLKFAG